METMGYEAIDYEAKGIVFNMQRFSVHDGPGIRTIVFLKGCPLRCTWCSNPESQTLNPVIMYQPEECIHCGRCLLVCKHGALSPDNPGLVDRSKCKGCGECAAVCPTGALTLKGKAMTVTEVIKELKKDATAFRRSGGGVTISGGEGLVQHEFTTQLLRACHAQGWNTAIETTGYASPEIVEKVIPHVDLVLMDIKSMNGEKHKEQCGVDNQLILDNAKRISQISKTVVRVPVIPGFNYTKEDIDAIAAFVKTLNGVTTLHLLPYHSLGSNKYELLGREYGMGSQANLHAEDVKELKEIVQRHGLDCVIGG